MDKLDLRLKSLRKQVPGSDTASFYDNILHKALAHQAPIIQFNQLKKIAIAAAVLVLINTSVVFWSLHKDTKNIAATSNTGYLQSFNLSIY